MTKLRTPKIYDLHEIKLTTRVGLRTLEMSGWEFRDFIRLYHILKQRNNLKRAEDLEVFLKQVAKMLNFEDFNIDQDVSLKNVGIDNG